LPNHRPLGRVNRVLRHQRSFEYHMICEIHSKSYKQKHPRKDTIDDCQPPLTPMDATNVTLAEGHLKKADGRSHELDDLTWLHDRPEDEVYKLLIDCFSLHRTQQLSKTVSGVDFVTRKTLIDFLQKAEEKKIMPGWWERSKRSARRRHCGTLQLRSNADAFGSSSHLNRQLWKNHSTRTTKFDSIVRTLWTNLQHDSRGYRTKVMKIKSDSLYHEHRGPSLLTQLRKHPSPAKAVPVPENFCPQKSSMSIDSINSIPSCRSRISIIVTPHIHPARITSGTQLHNLDHQRSVQLALYLAPITQIYCCALSDITLCPTKRQLLHFDSVTIIIPAFLMILVLPVH
ncbi:hypothetical protein KCU66_g6, partial [Aureobasidium melanogenum]